MSLVVTGIFSFRDLNVDLLPKADPATVTVNVRLPGASPDEMSSSVAEPLEQALSGVAGVDEIESRLGVGTRAHHREVRPRAGHQRGGAGHAREGRGRASAACRRRCCRRSSPRSIPTRSRSSRSRLAGPYPLRTHHRDRRQADPPRARGGGRRRRGDDCRRPRARSPRRARPREADRARPQRRPGPRRDPRGQRRGAGRAHRPGRRRGHAAHARPVRSASTSSARSSSPPRAARRSASPTSRDVEDTEEDARTSAFLDGQRAVVIDVRRQSGQNTIAVIAASSRRSRSSSRSFRPDLKIVHAARRLALHLRVDRLAPGAPDPRQPAREPDRPALHPQHPGDDHQRAGHSGLAHRDASR